MEIVGGIKDKIDEWKGFKEWSEFGAVYWIDYID